MDIKGIEDSELATKLKNLRESIQKISNVMDKLFEANAYDTLTPDEKIKHDLFISYCLNTLYWMHLRCKGLDPNLSDVKEELKRTQNYMRKVKDVQESLKNKPKINKKAAGRFIKSGLFDPNQPPPNKKIKFED